MFEASAPFPAKLLRTGALQRYVRDREAPRYYFTQLFGFRAIAASTPGVETALEERSVLFEPGGCPLQIFMEDAVRFVGNGQASPFFFELIQRKGYGGFGAGNFGALFNGVERLQFEPRRCRTVPVCGNPARANCAAPGYRNA